MHMRSAKYGARAGCANNAGGQNLNGEIFVILLRTHAVNFLFEKLARNAREVLAAHIEYQHARRSVIDYAEAIRR